MKLATVSGMVEDLLTSGAAQRIVRRAGPIGQQIVNDAATVTSQVGKFLGRVATFAIIGAAMNEP